MNQPVLPKVLVIGLDGIPSLVLSRDVLADLPNLAGLVARGASGPLISTIPPITVPAWSSMFCGRDPGELGLYGFRNRAQPGYDSMVRADSRSVLFPRLWDHVARVGGRSLVVGVPQTYPPPTVVGDLIAGFDTPTELERAVSSPELGQWVRQIAPNYRFDASDFRNAPRRETLRLLREMTTDRLRVMTRLLRERQWDLAIYCEIGPDRMHHCFWSDQDPRHPLHDPGSEFGSAIRNYYKLLDEGIAELLKAVPSDTAVIVASDHGAKAMQGGICINQLLIREGWLVLKSQPNAPTDLVPEMVDWSRTKAWAYGGYYSRVFLNIKGREPNGIVSPDQVVDTREELAALLANIALSNGQTVKSEVVLPERAFRKVRGNPPDLMVFFDDLDYRSLGSVGHPDIWMIGNDTGLDEANHSWDGFYVWAPPGATAAPDRSANILDVTPTLLGYMGIPTPAGLSENLLSEVRSR